MTSSNPCPAWCAAEYPVGESGHIHRGPATSVTVGRAKTSLARLSLPSVMVTPFLPEGASAQPTVLVFTTASSGLPALLSRRDAEEVAEVISALAVATPAQHREIAAAIRQAAALIEGEVGVDDVA